MSCEHEQELISYLVDGRQPGGERENFMAHLESCRHCSTQLESMRKIRGGLRALKGAPVPPALQARLRVVASHEYARRNRIRYWTDRARLWFDNLMRPVALPLVGGLFSATIIFSVLVPSLSAQHAEYDDVLVIDPSGSVVVEAPNQTYRAENSDGTHDQSQWVSDLPRIEPAYSAVPEDANVVWFLIGENGKVTDYKVASGHLTEDMKNTIMISKFNPATFLGMPTPGLIKMVQRSSNRRALRS